jgi:hypothetical protein
MGIKGYERSSIILSGDGCGFLLMIHVVYAMHEKHENAVIMRNMLGLCRGEFNRPRA